LRIFEGVPDLRDALDLAPVFLPFAPFRAPLELFLLAIDVFLFIAFAALFLVPDVFLAPALDLLTVFFLPLVTLDLVLVFAADVFLVDAFAPVFLVVEPFFDPALSFASPVVLRVDVFFDPAFGLVADAFLTDALGFVDFFPATFVFVPDLAFVEEVFLFDFLETADFFAPDFAFEDADFLPVVSFFDPDLGLFDFAFGLVLDLDNLEGFLPAIDLALVLLAFLALTFDVFVLFPDFFSALEGFAPFTFKAVFDLGDLDVLPVTDLDLTVLVDLEVLALAFFLDLLNALELFADLTALEVLELPFAVLAALDLEDLTPLAFFATLVLAEDGVFVVFPLVILVLFRLEAALDFAAVDLAALRDVALLALIADLPNFADFALFVIFPFAKADDLAVFILLLEAAFAFATDDLVALRPVALLALVADLTDFAFFVGLPFTRVEDLAVFPLVILVPFNFAAVDLRPLRGVALPAFAADLSIFAPFFALTLARVGDLTPLASLVSLLLEIAFAFATGDLVASLLDVTSFVALPFAKALDLPVAFSLLACTLF
jgi:hypothetical protein